MAISNPLSGEIQRLVLRGKVEQVQTLAQPQYPWSHGKRRVLRAKVRSRSVVRVEIVVAVRSLAKIVSLSWVRQLLLICMCMI